MSFTGAPERWRDRGVRWFTPGGSTLRDGARLAIINSALLIVAGFLWLLALVVNRIIDLVLPWPVIATRFIGLVALAVVAVVVAYLFADAHGDAARRTQRNVRSDLLGVIGALPFAVFAVSMTTEAILRLLVALIRLNGGHFADALERLILALVFVALTIAVVVAARVAERD
jgi:amino acid permease